jgi:predicted lysophospholipase L1 biosynthesis ABC-type transport system permease subunit
MHIPLLAGRDFLAAEVYPRAAIVNETFAKTYFGGANPVGKSFARNPQEQPIQIVGLMRDARYRGMREAMPPVAFFPFTGVDQNGQPEPRGAAAFVVRTANADPLALAQVLRREVAKARSEFRVSNVRTQQELVDQHTVRERLLALLALFFAVVALVLAGVGLFGVLDYAVVQRRREIGIRLAIGAPRAAVVRSVTAPALAMVALGVVVGLLLGGAVERDLKALLYGVKATDPAVLAAPVLALLAAALLATLRPALRAVHTDPVQTLRSE